MIFKTIIKRWDRKSPLTKRQEFVAVTIVLTVGLILTQLVAIEWRYPFVAGLSLSAYLLSAFGLREDLRGVEWVTLLVLPTAFTAAVSLFYFLLPVRWLTRLPVAALYAIGIYAILLTENIYNVAADRSIALLRAAHSVGALLTLATYFLLILTILTVRLPVFFSMVAVGVATFFLSLQSLWSVELTDVLTSRLKQIVVAISIVFFELAWVFAFWPAKLVLIALFLTTSYYAVVGMAQQYLVDKLYKKTAVEFLAVTAIVFGLLLLTTHWRGPV